MSSQTTRPILPKPPDKGKVRSSDPGQPWLADATAEAIIFAPELNYIDTLGLTVVYEDDLPLPSANALRLDPEEEGVQSLRPNGVIANVPNRMGVPRGHTWVCTARDCGATNFAPEWANDLLGEFRRFLPDARCRYTVAGRYLCEQGMVPLPAYLPQTSVDEEVPDMPALEWWECCVCDRFHGLPLDVATPYELNGDRGVHSYARCDHDKEEREAGKTTRGYYESEPHDLCWNCKWSFKPEDLDKSRPGEHIDFKLQNFFQIQLDWLGKGGKGVGGEHISYMPRHTWDKLWIGSDAKAQKLPEVQSRSVRDKFKRMVDANFVPAPPNFTPKSWECCKCGRVRNLPSWISHVWNQKIQILPWTICKGLIREESHHHFGLCTHVICKGCKYSKNGDEEVKEAPIPLTIRCCSCYTWREVPLDVVTYQDFWRRRGLCMVDVYCSEKGWHNCSHPICFQCWWPGTDTWMKTKNFKVDRSLPIKRQTVKDKSVESSKEDANSEPKGVE